MERRPNEQMDSERRMTDRILWSIVAVIFVIAAAYFYTHRAPAPPAPPPAPAPQAETPVAPPPPVVAPAQHFPVPESVPETPAKPLPQLGDSDADFMDALSGLVGKAATDGFLVPKDIIRNLVATIDNLTAEKASVRLWPIKTTAGNFTVSGTEPNLTISQDNFSRYSPLMHVVAAVDARKLVALYFHYYPLFQEAYADLGHPGGYFNDRLVAVIDHLLKTPQVTAPIKLVHPSVYYKFADPKLEALSAGQKILLRIGPVNAAVVKSKLTEIRHLVAGATLPTRD